MNAPFEFENAIGNDASLPEQVAERISQLIIDQRLTYQDKLPNEFELAAQLHVGRGTVREAIKLLAARNVVVIKRGKGTFVARHPGEVDDPLGFAYYPDQMRLAMDLLEVRTRLEPWVASSAARRATPENLDRVREASLLVEEDIFSGRDHLKRDTEFHISIAQCTQNLVVPKLIPIIIYSVELFGSLNGNVLLSETVADHRDITAAICAHDPKAAEKAMEEHMEQNRRELEAILKELGRS